MLENTDLDIAAMHASLERTIREAQKYSAEHDKLVSERQKLDAERDKMIKETGLEIWKVVITALGTGSALTVAIIGITKFFL